MTTPNETSNAPITENTMPKPRQTRADVMTRNLTAFESFSALVEAGKRGYSPTLKGSYEAMDLARMFNAVMASHQIRVEAFQ
jgi:hypothetical protein